MQLDWWTLGFQAINVALLVWLLGRVFWRPMADLIARREADVARTLAEAEAAKSKAVSALADAKARAEAAETEHAAARTAMHDKVAQERAALLAAARKEAQALAETERAARAAEAEAAEAAYGRRAGDLALAMAERIGRRLDGPALRASYLARLSERAAALNAAERAEIAEMPGLVLRASCELPSEEATEVRDRLTETFGTSFAPSVEAHPRLISGFEIAAPTLRLGDSWRNDLDTIARELGDDGA